MKASRYFLVWFATVFILACNNTPEPPAALKPSPARNGNGSKASQTIVNPPPVASAFDQSPMDMTYYPVDFPKMKSQRKELGLPQARVIYSRPQRHERTIFGGLQKYGQPWRMGANEATEIQFFADATVNGKRIAKGTYTLYCIPQEKEWTIVFNSGVYTWGLQFDATKDVLRTTIPIEIIPQPIEVLTIAFAEENGAALLSIEWDFVKAKLPIRF